MKKFITIFITFSVVFISYLLAIDFTIESLLSYKIIEPILIALGVSIITYIFFWKNK